MGGSGHLQSKETRWVSKCHLLRAAGQTPLLAMDSQGQVGVYPLRLWLPCSPCSQCSLPLPVLAHPHIHPSSASSLHCFLKPGCHIRSHQFPEGGGTEGGGKD